MSAQQADDGEWVDIPAPTVAKSAQVDDSSEWVDIPKPQLDLLRNAPPGFVLDTSEDNSAQTAPAKQGQQAEQNIPNPQEWLKQHRALKLKPGAPDPQEWLKQRRASQQATKPVTTPEEEWLAKRRFERVGIGALSLFGGVAFIWSLTWAIGWILRWLP